MIKNIRLSLQDIAGKEYTDKVCAASAALGIGKADELQKLAAAEIDFFPAEFSAELDRLTDCIGKKITDALEKSSSGAGTAAFDHALSRSSAPLSAIGAFRVGENGILAAAGKSEHYQASLGHNFPGFKLIGIASALGITNLTHNNTRGHLTRLLEREIVRSANGIAPGDEKAINAVLESDEPHVLNRVINLETGSLACEAALKMMLARFYKLQSHFDPPRYSGKTPVFLVMGDFNGGREANYHGTTIFAQLLRNMWSDLYDGMEKAGLLKIIGVPINDFDGFCKIVEKYDSGDTKIAGFIHELVLMNYGGIRLDTAYVQNCHKLCHEHDIPCFVDEIQSCIWSPETFLFKEYGLHPDFVSIGKGFPGGQYPASKILTTAKMDNLNLFGALVTNGQEELASLANLITMRFAENNAEHIRSIGKIWQQELNNLAEKYPDMINRIEGDGLLSAIFFRTEDLTVRFCKSLNYSSFIDISAQTYKANCPPAALSKLPLITSEKLLSCIISEMERTLLSMRG